jgi:hypothetical protein
VAQYTKDIYNRAKGPGQAIADPRESEARDREASLRAERALQEQIQSGRRDAGLQLRQQQQAAEQFFASLGFQRQQLAATQAEAEASRNFQGQNREDTQQHEFAQGAWSRQAASQEADRGRAFQGQQGDLNREQTAALAQAQLMDALAGRQQQQGQFDAQFGQRDEHFNAEQERAQTRFEAEQEAAALDRAMRSKQFGQNFGLQQTQANRSNKQWDQSFGLQQDQFDFLKGEPGREQDAQRQTVMGPIIQALGEARQAGEPLDPTLNVARATIQAMPPAQREAATQDLVQFYHAAGLTPPRLDIHTPAEPQGFFQSINPWSERARESRATKPERDWTGGLKAWLDGVSRSVN